MLCINQGLRLCGTRAFNPDSAVPADAMSEEQTFRSEANGSLPLSGHRSSVVVAAQPWLSVWAQPWVCR
jgi:hypothetical protein